MRLQTTFTFGRSCDPPNYSHEYIFRLVWLPKNIPGNRFAGGIICLVQRLKTQKAKKKPLWAEELMKLLHGDRIPPDRIELGLAWLRDAGKTDKKLICLAGK